MRKIEKLYSFLFVACLLGLGQAFAAWDGSIATTDPDTEIGSDGNIYYKIETEAQLAWYAANYEKGNAKLTADLDMGGHLWTPIAAGDGSKKYNKVFDGNHHRISNLYINAEDFINNNNKTYAQNLGFIGCLTGTVKNLIIENISVYGYGSGFLKDKVDTEAKPLSIGTVVGWQSENSSLIDGCYVTGKIITSGDGQAVGGIVGNIGGGTVTNCVSYASIDANGKAYVGGIAGYAKKFNNNSSVAIASCVYAGDNLSSTGSGAAGGIVGYQYKGVVTVSNVTYDSGLGLNGFGATNGGQVNGTNNPDLEYLDDQTTQTDNLNSEAIVCALNGINPDSTCKTEPWEMGETSLSLNGYGADGYRITFDANGGSFSNGLTTVEKFVKAEYIINDEGVENPSWDEDHVFAGWSSKNSSEDVEAYMNAANGVVTIKAIWNPVYTITFKSINGEINGTFPDGSSTPKTVKVESGKQISLQGIDRPTTFTENGIKYNFVGWADENDPTHAYVENGLDNLPIAMEDLSLVAVWTTAEVWTVSFFANDIAVASYVSSVYDNEKATEWVPERDGYTFVGWFENENFDGESFDFDQVITMDYSLYAKWNQDSYNITYVMSCSDECVNTNDNQYTVDGLNLSDPTWDDAHHFLGWFKDPEFKNKVSSISAGTTGDLTLYAEWETIVYEITYRAGELGSGFVDPEYKTHGIDYTIRDTSYTRKGAKQSGWVSSGGVNYEYSSTYSVDAPLVLYPTWNLINYAISYTCNHCDISDVSVYPRSYTVESSFGLPFPEVDDGYVFIGWFKKENYTSQLNNVQAGSTGKLTLFGKVLEKYSITYVGTDEPRNDDWYTIEKAITFRAPAPREGYTFGGWYDNAEFTGEPVEGIAAGSTGDKTFYAKWEPEAPVVNQYGGITVTTYPDGTKSAEIDDTSLETVEITEDVAVDTVSFSRVFSSGKMSTVMFPFSIGTSAVQGGKFYELVTLGKVGTRWVAEAQEPEAGEIVANKPYLVMPSADGTLSFNLNGPVTFNTNNMQPTSLGDGWVFKGTYVYHKFTANDPELGSAYGFAATASNGVQVGQFVKAGSGAWIRPMRAYLVHNTAKSATRSVSARRLMDVSELPETIDLKITDGKGEVIGWAAVDTRTGEFRADRWFDLRGRRLNGKPTTKGTYYNNGRKVIIK